MDWANERYVRLYTRDTPEWLCMEWQARALWPHLIRKADRSGVLANKLGVRGIAVLVGLPVEVVEPGLANLLEDGCLREHPLGFVIPNFIEAQETPQSDAMRQRESRERRRSVTKRDSESRNVTESHAVSREVTRGHAASQLVTPSQTSPDQSEPDLGENAPASRQLPTEPPAPEALTLQPSPTKPPRPAKATKHRLPATWSPRPQERERAAREGINAELEAERFRDHHTARANTMADWDAAFRTWLGNAQRFANGTRNGPGSSAERASEPPRKIPTLVR